MSEKDFRALADRKNQTRLHALETPDLYARHFDGKENEIVAAYGDGRGAGVFKFLKRFDDPESSFSASVLINKQDGHAVILYKGTDLPYRNEGGGRLGHQGDLETILQARSAMFSMQTDPAEEAYREIVNNPAVKTVEIVGYSLGSQHLNFLAAKYGARGTAIADMGIAPEAVSFLDKYNKAHGFPARGGDMYDNVTVLHLDSDILPKQFAAGPTRGRTIDLGKGWSDDWDSGESTSQNTGIVMLFNIAGGAKKIFGMASEAEVKFLGAAHVPQIYATHAARHLAEEQKAQEPRSALNEQFQAVTSGPGLKPPTPSPVISYERDTPPVIKDKPFP